MHLRSRLVHLWAALLVAAFLPYFALGQIAAANGTISGVVTDPQSQVVAGAKVIVANADFGTSRTFTTDDSGWFTAAALSSGTYSIEVQASGFKTKRLARVMLSVGSSIRLMVKLDLAAISQEITVTGRSTPVEGNTVAPEVNKQDVQVGNFLAGLTVTYLPNRDRDFSQFGLLSAGTTSSANGGLIVAGQRTNSAKTNVDGADFNDPLQGGQRGAGDRALFLPQTVIREFQVLHAGASADVGETNAGFINIITKEGSNKFHGEAFYVLRPSALSSADAFGHSLDDLQNEFGGSLGGPLKRNRAFFYIGGEQDLLHVPYWSQFQAQAPGDVVPFSLVSLQRQVLGDNNPSAVFGRLDFLLNSSNTLNLQFNFNRAHATNIADGSTREDESPDHGQSLSGHSTWTRANLNTVFSSQTINQLLMQWGTDQRDFRPNSTAPEIVINGFGTLGGNGLSPHSYSSDQFRSGDDISMSRGGRIFHLGGEFAYDPATEQHEANLNGRFDFNSLADFLAGLPRRYQQTFLNGESRYNGAVREVGLYLTGKLPLSKRLTLTAGLRWQGQWNPQPPRPNANIVQTARIPNDLQQWQPRLGLAWNPRSSTVLRFSAGIYDAPTPATIFQRIFTDNGLNSVVSDSEFDPQLLTLVSSTGKLLSPPPGLSTPAALVVGISPAFRNPRSFQASASVEQQFGPKFSVSLGYLRNSTWRLQRRVDENLSRPVSGPDGLPIFTSVRPDPSIGRLLVNQSSAHSSYHGLLWTANWQLPHRSQLSWNYTLSSTRDYDSSLGPFGPDFALNPFALRGERAYSSFDIRQNFNVSGVTNLPLGFKINPILVVRSGAPYTPVVGFDLQNDANDLNDRAFSQRAIAPRNSLRQPAFVNLDIRLVKDFALRGEGHHLDLFMDIFNVTGASNRYFGTEGISVVGTAVQPVFTAGQPLYAPDTTRLGSTRQIQFTARIVAF